MKIYANCDTQDLPLNSSAVSWEENNLTNDKLNFSNGSVGVVADGKPIPGTQELIQAGMLITTAIQHVPHYFLSDFSAGILKEIHNMGNQNKRYVLCFEFDAATASEPVLEVWDDANLDSFDDYCLGEGVANNSWMWGITTTNGLPTSSWVGDTPTVGYKLAGSSSTHFLWLNDHAGALLTAKNLYCQLKIIVPASFAHAKSEAPCIVIKYTSN